MERRTSGAVTSRAASSIGSIQIRIEKSASPMICTCATPSIVDIRGLMTRLMYSVICSGVMFGFCTARYMMANCRPVPLTITGSLASLGNLPRTWLTFDITSVSAASGFEPSFMWTVTVLAEVRALRGHVVDVFRRRDGARRSAP